MLLSHTGLCCSNAPKVSDPGVIRTFQARLQCLCQPGSAGWPMQPVSLFHCLLLVRCIMLRCVLCSPFNRELQLRPSVPSAGRSRCLSDAQ